MKKYSFLKYTAGILGVCLALTFSSCSSDDDYTPGPQTVEGAVAAYFDSSNSSTFIMTPSDESIELTVSRRDTTAAADVPIKMVSGDSATIKVPSKLSFAAGEKTKTLAITTKGLVNKTQYKFTLNIGEAAADHYSKLDGTTSYSGNIVVSQWVKEKANLDFYYDGHQELPANQSDLYHLEGFNQFYLTNFMGTGQPMYFTISSDTLQVDEPDTWTGELVPMEGKGATTYDYSTYKLNYVVAGTAANGDYIYNWTHDGVNIEYFDWYGGYNYSTYSWIDFKSEYIYLYGYISSDAYEGYATVYGVW